MVRLCQYTALLVLVLILGILTVLIWQATPAIAQFGLGFWFTSTWNPPKNEFGLWPQIYGTLVSSGLALAIATPLGLLAAIALSETWPSFPRLGQTLLLQLIQLLAAIPSVVYGFWGIFVLVPWLRTYTASLGFRDRGLFPASLVLALMILPNVIAGCHQGLTSLSSQLRLAAISLGASRWQCLLGIEIPGAISSIISTVLLALSRAMGETMAVTMLIGNSPRLDFSIFAPASTIASLLANQYQEATGIQTAALFYATLVLMLLTLTINAIAQINRPQA